MAESSYSQKTTTRRRRSIKGKERAIDSSPLPQHIPLPASDDQPEASSSRLIPYPPTKDEQSGPNVRTKKEKKPRHKGKHAADGLAGPSSGVPPSTSAAGPSDKVRKKKNRTKKDPLQEPNDEDEQDLGRHPWPLVPLAQNEISRIPPVWSRDGRFYLSAAGRSVYIHSTTLPAFKRLSTIVVRDKAISAMLLHPTNPLQLITAGDEGRIQIWDWVEGRLVRTIHIDGARSIHQMCLGKVLGAWWIFVTLLTSKGHFTTYRVSLTPSAKSTHPSFVVGKLSAAPSALFMSPRNTYLVALAGNKAYSYRLPDNTDIEKSWKPVTVKFVSDQIFTCGAFAPDRNIAGRTEEWFATGDVFGVIRLWHGLGDAFRQLEAATITPQGSVKPEKALNMGPSRLPTTSLHWHAHAVAAIAFTASGAQLLSVGEESVLVQWHLASGKREYIPRLGGRPILTLAIKPASRGNEEEWWMGFADGSVVKVGSSSGQISTVGQNVKLDPLRPSATGPYPLAFHPSTKSLVVPSSHPSTLQFIDTTNSSVLFDLEVAPSNRISRRDDKEHLPVAVDHVAFSGAQGGISWWMASSESREGDEMEGGGYVRNLKIWKWDNQRYVTNTQLPRSHGSADITNLLFSPIRPSSGSDAASAPYLLTCSNDGIAKLWHVRAAKKSEQGKVSTKKAPAYDLFWSTRSTFSYRSLGILDAAFSPDGTILALAHGPVVTLWDIDSNVMLKALDSGAVPSLKKIAFIGSEGRWLAGIGEKKGLCVWDMLSCEVSWALPQQSFEHLVPHPSSPTFAVTHQTAQFNSISIFSVTSSSSLRTVSLAQPLRLVTTLAQTSPRPDEFHFIGVAHSGEMFRFGDIPAPVRQTANAISTANDKKSTSIWQEMFGKEAFLDDLASFDTEAEQHRAATALQSRAAKSGRPTDVFEGPSHTLPPVGLLFDAFIDEILRTAKPTSNIEQAPANAQDEIQYREEDESPINGVSSESMRQDRGKKVSDKEVAELEVFFRDLLANKPAPPHTPVSTKLNGSLPIGLTGSKAPSGVVANGISHAHGDREEEDEVEEEEGGDDQDGAGEVEQTPTKRVGKSKLTPGSKGKSTPTANGTKSKDIDGEREIDVALPNESASKKRGKKRRAPREDGA